MDTQLISHRITDWLDHVGMSQAELARRARLSPTTVSHLVNEKIEQPRRATVYKIAREVGAENVERFLAGPLEDALQGQGNAWLLEHSSHRVLMDFDTWARKLSTEGQAEGLDASPHGISLDTPRTEAEVLAEGLDALTSELDGLVRGIREEILTRQNADEVLDKTAALRRDLRQELRRRYTEKRVALLALEDALIASEVERMPDTSALDALRSGSAA